MVYHNAYAEFQARFIIRCLLCVYPDRCCHRAGACIMMMTQKPTPVVTVKCLKHREFRKCQATLISLEFLLQTVRVAQHE